MQEFLSNLTSQEWFVTMVSYLSANVMVLILFGVKLIKAKINNNQLIESIAAREAKLTEALNAKFVEKLQEYQTTVSSSLDNIDSKISEKLKLDRNTTKAVIEEKGKSFDEIISQLDLNLDGDVKEE